MGTVCTVHHAQCIAVYHELPAVATVPLPGGTVLAASVNYTHPLDDRPTYHSFCFYLEEERERGWERNSKGEKGMGRVEKREREREREERPIWSRAQGDKWGQKV
jgi:hypothetical protein